MSQENKERIAKLTAEVEELKDDLSDTEDAVKRLVNEKSDEEAYLLEIISAARDVLISFQHELSYLPQQQAYKTTMSANEQLCAKTIEDLGTVLASRATRTPPQEGR